jgi:hypothetical protein
MDAAALESRAYEICAYDTGLIMEGSMNTDPVSMRPVFYNVALHIKAAREHAVARDPQAAIKEFDTAIHKLRELPPERVRDVLLAHAMLGKYQTLTLEKDKQSQKLALESLHVGVSYARSTRDPLARAIAEECLAGLDATL